MEDLQPMKVPFLCSLLLLGSSFGYSQNGLIDSLQGLLRENPSPLERIDLQLGLARFSIFSGQFKQALNYSQNALAEAQRADFLPGQVQALHQQSIAYYELGDFPESEVKTTEANRLATQADDPAIVFSLRLQAANALRLEEGQPEASLQALRAILADLPSGTSPYQLADLYQSLGHTYWSLREESLAEEAFKTAIQFTHAEPPILPELDWVSARHLDRGQLQRARLYVHWSEILAERLQYQGAITLVQKGIDILETLQVPSQQAWAYEKMGYYYIGRYQVVEALEYYEEARKIYQDLGYMLALADLDMSFAQVFRDLEEFDEAIQYYEKAELTWVRIGDTTGWLSCIRLKGGILNQDLQLEAAEHVLQAGVQLALSYAEDTELSDLYFNLSETYHLKKDYPKTLQYAHWALPGFQRHGYIDGVVLAYRNLAIAHQHLQQADSAQFYLDLMKEELAASENPSFWGHYYRTQSKFSESQGDYQAALQHYQAFFEIADSVKTQRSQEALRKEQVKQDIASFIAETEAANTQVAILSTQNKIYLGFASLLVALLSVVGYLFYRLRKISRDLAQKNRALEELNQTKDKFFGIIAHDLRNPILALENVGGLMERYLQNDARDRLERLSQRVDATAKRLSALLDNLLNWALLQQGVIPYHPSHLLVEPIAQETIEMFALSASMKQIDLAVELPPDLRVRADENALRTILRNLLSNAIKFTPAGGRVSVTAYSRPGQVLIQVQDTGLGMDAQLVDRLFHLGGRSQQGTAGERGTGLGLILVKELTSLNQGSLQVESVLREGSVFRVGLPAA